MVPRERELFHPSTIDVSPFGYVIAHQTLPALMWSGPALMRSGKDVITTYPRVPQTDARRREQRRGQTRELAATQQPPQRQREQQPDVFGKKRTRRRRHHQERPRWEERRRARLQCRWTGGREWLVRRCLDIDLERNGGRSLRGFLQRCGVWCHARECGSVAGCSAKRPAHFCPAPPVLQGIVIALFRLGSLFGVNCKWKKRALGTPDVGAQVGTDECEIQPGRHISRLNEKLSQ